MDAFQEVDTVGHHPALRKAQLPRQGRRGSGADDQEGVLSRQPPDVRVRCWSTSPRTSPQFRLNSSTRKRSRCVRTIPVVKGHAGQIKKAVQLLLEAERPMIYTGGGVILANASAQLTELTKLLGFPITNTLMGLGGYPATDGQFLGMLGMHGTYEANMAMQNCDVLLAIGARFDDRVIGNPAHFAQNPAQDHPHRHRSVVDLQARQGRCADRRPRPRGARRVSSPDQGRCEAPGCCKAEALVEDRSKNGAARTACAMTTGRRSSSRSSWSRSSTR